MAPTQKGNFSCPELDLFSSPSSKGRYHKVTVTQALPPSQLQKPHVYSIKKDSVYAVLQSTQTPAFVILELSVD